MRLGNIFYVNTYGVVLRRLVFRDENALRDAVIVMARENGFVIDKEKCYDLSSGRMCVDLEMRREGGVVVVETKMPKRSRNRILGNALVQIRRYIDNIYGHGTSVVGWIVMGTHFSGLILKYLPCLASGSRLYVGFPITNGERVCLWLASGRGWVTGASHVCTDVGKVLETRGVDIEELRLSDDQFFDLVVYDLYMQDIIELKRIGFGDELIGRIKKVCSLRGYDIDRYGRIVEAWNKLEHYDRKDKNIVNIIDYLSLRPSNTKNPRPKGRRGGQMYIG